MSSMMGSSHKKPIYSNPQKLQADNIHQYFNAPQNQAVGGLVDPMLDPNANANFITVKENFKANPDSPEVFFLFVKTKIVPRTF